MIVQLNVLGLSVKDWVTSQMNIAHVVVVKENQILQYSFELLEIDVTNPFLPQLYIGVGSMTLGKHCQFHLVRIESEHSTFSSIASENLAFLYVETSSVIEPNLHALLHHVVD